MRSEENEFIEIIRLESVAQAAENFARINFNETRAVMLVVEDLAVAAAAAPDFYPTIENFPVPVILALKSRAFSAAAAELVAACHLCVAAADAKIGDFSAEEALRRGLINIIAAFDEVEAEAIALAEKIARLAPPAIRACLKAVVEGSRLPLEKGLEIESGLFAEIFSTEDMREGTRAFLERRTPNFQGK